MLQPGTDIDPKEFNIYFHHGTRMMQMKENLCNLIGTPKGTAFDVIPNIKNKSFFLHVHDGGSYRFSGWKDPKRGNCVCIRSLWDTLGIRPKDGKKGFHPTFIKVVDPDNQKYEIGLPEDIIKSVPDQFLFGSGCEAPLRGPHQPQISDTDLWSLFVKTPEKPTKKIEVKPEEPKSIVPIINMVSTETGIKISCIDKFSIEISDKMLKKIIGLLKD